MCEKNKYKGFSLLELIIVILLIGITSAIAIPNINEWITDRKVKKEVHKFVGEINEMKSKVISGQYPLAMVRWSTYSNQYASLRKYYMAPMRSSMRRAGSITFPFNTFEPDMVKLLPQIFLSVKTLGNGREESGAMGR